MPKSRIHPGDLPRASLRLSAIIAISAGVIAITLNLALSSI